MKNEKIYYIIGGLIIIGVGLLLSFNQGSKGYAPIAASEMVASEDGVSSETTQTIYVQISGAVTKPGLYQMKSGQRINDLLTEAEAINYNPACINLAQKLVDEQNLYIPAKNEQCPKQLAIGIDQTVNINQASSLELQTLSGIGEAKALSIIEYRELNGTFETKQQLTEVEGISDGLLESIEDSISLS